MKIIVTGSRDWDDTLAIESALTAFYRPAVRRGRLFEVVHGACPTGADAIAEEWVQSTGWTVSWDYPADWSRYGRAAGPKRNTHMVEENLDADYVLGFPLGESRGTRGCMAYAETKGLNVINLGDR